MKSVQHLFADLTAALEEIHSIAVEGQSPHATPDIHEGLLACSRLGVEGLQGLVRSIDEALTRLRL